MKRYLFCEYKKTRRKYIFVMAVAITAVALCWGLYGKYNESALKKRLDDDALSASAFEYNFYAAAVNCSRLKICRYRNLNDETIMFGYAEAKTVRR